MRNNGILWTTIWTLTALLATGSALAQSQEVSFHWAPSPVVSPDGDALAPAVDYQVWVVRDDGEPEMLASVKDTTYTLTVEPGVVHRLGVRGVDFAGRFSPMSELSEPVYIEGEADRGGDTPPIAGQLRPNYPNPFNPETRIVYGIPADFDADAPVRLEIFNVAGERVRVLETEATPGWHEVVWNGADDAGQPASTGLYVTRFVCGTNVEVRKMTLVK